MLCISFFCCILKVQILGPFIFSQEIFATTTSKQCLYINMKFTHYLDPNKYANKYGKKEIVAFYSLGP